jgi:N utilization substance protein A
MKNEFELAFNEIAEARTLDRKVVLDALQTALVSAYRKDTNASAAQNIEAKIDPNTGRARLFVEKEVVDDVLNPLTEVTLEEARFYEPECQYGDVVMVQVERTTKNFGRIAAQTAKQVILQKIREAERKALFEEFKEKEGDIVSASVQSVSGGKVTVNLNNGRAEGTLAKSQQIPRENYKPGDKIRVYIQEVKELSRGPEIVVSRSHRNMLRRLLEFEVPEIYNGSIEIKNIAREAGGRSKVAVVALQEGIDPVGACVGMRGIRIQNIVKELHDEKIDVIEWVPNQEDFIAKALSPARVKGVYLEDDPDIGRTASVIVQDDQLSLAIGREGQNARLAAKLTGWRIDIKSVSEAVNTALEQLHVGAMAAIRERHETLIAEVRRIMDKKNAGLAVMPEEYTTLASFADIVERHLVGLRNEARKARLAEINAVRQTLPRRAFEIPVTRLDLPDSIIESLQPLENAGEIMLRFLIDENRLRRLLGNQSDTALMQVQAALDKIVYVDEEPDLDDFEDFSEDQEVEEVEDAEESEYALGDELEIAAAGKAAPAGRAVPVVDDDEVVDVLEVIEEDDGAKDKKREKDKKKKGKQRRQQPGFDEEVDPFGSKRPRKGGRKRDDWGGYR